MSSADRYLPHYTIQDYRLWDGDWELWQGIPVAMTPSPFGPHSKVLISAATAIKNSIDAAGCDATVLAEIDWIISEDTVVRPDVLVMCGAEPPRHVEKSPAVVLEILSDSTRTRDTGHKRMLYQDNSVPYYLLLDPDASRLTALQLSQSGTYAEIECKRSLTLTIGDHCQLKIAVDRLFR